MVGHVPVGGDAPITVQSMTNTPTTDVEATVAQIQAMEEAGADIVRVSCPDVESTAAFGQIVDQTSVPIVADIHFHYKRALEAADAGAACLRDQPWQYWFQRARDGGCASRKGQRLLNPCGRERRKPGKALVGKIWRALPRSAG